MDENAAKPNTTTLSLDSQLAELRSLLNFLSSRPNGLAPLSSNRRTQSNIHTTSPIDLMDSDIHNPNLLVQRVFAIQQGLHSSENRSTPSDSVAFAFLLRAKSELTDRAWPATAESITFTAMVNMHLLAGEVDDDIIRTHRSWGREAKLFARSIQRLRFYVAMLSVTLILVTAIASVPFSSLGFSLGIDGSFDELRVAVGISSLSAFYALLGAMLSTLRSIHRKTADNLLDLRQRSRNFSNTLSGFFVGGMVGLFSISTIHGAEAHGTTILAVPAISFLSGYFTDPILTLLDKLVAFFTIIQAPRQRSPRQLNNLIKIQSDIAGTVTEIHEQFERLQNNVTLDNFAGSLILRVATSAGTNIPISEHTMVFDESNPEASSTGVSALLTSGEQYQLSIELSRDTNSAPDAVVFPFSTGEGTLPDLITFGVNLDSSEDILFAPKQHELALPRALTSVGFNAAFLAPTQPGLHDVYVEVSQKRRLVSVGRLPILVIGTSP